MKITMKLLLFLFATQIAKADCGFGFTFYPKNPTVYKNTKIIIEGYGWGKYASLLKDLDEKYPIYLKSKNRKIRLQKETFICGQYMLCQAIFKLEKPLTSGEIYELEVQNLRQEDRRYFNQVVRRNLNGENENLSWLAKDEVDYQYPIIIKPLKFLKSSVIRYGCGPEVVSMFEFEAKDNSEIFILTELVQIETEESLKYYVSPGSTAFFEEKKLAIGRGMCSGAFKFEKGCNYKVRFKFYDVNGNTDDKWTNWVECENPWDKL